MKTAYVVSQFLRPERGYLPVSVHPTLAAAVAEITFRKGRVASLAHYPTADTYIVTAVSSHLT